MNEFKKVEKNESPVSTLFRYQIDLNGKILLDLKNLNETKHLKLGKNSIIWSIILYHKHRTNDKPLKKIVFQNVPEKILLLLQNQMKYFNIDFEQEYDDNHGFEIKKEYVTNIKKSIETDTSRIEKILKHHGIEDVQFYQTVTGREIQIRFRGYQIGKIKLTKNNENVSINDIISVNSKSGEPFISWSKTLIKERTDPNNDRYKQKEEHYLESILLKNLFNQELEIKGYKFEKPFDQSQIAFQFPSLMYQGPPSKKNHPKYIDILAKTDNRPAILELKVWGNGNSRGQYLFEGISQLLCYYNYLNELKISKDERFKELPELFEVSWRKPLLLLISNDIKNDERGCELRKYMKYVRFYLKSDIEFDFIEFDNEKWIKNREIHFLGEY